MRMKKQLVLAALVAIAATACTKTFQVQPTSEIPVGFGTWSNTMTKSYSPGTPWTDGDQFGVFGTKTVSSSSSIVFDDIKVRFDGSNWTYSPIRYWDPNATNYTFFAVLPFVDSSDSGDTKNSILKPEEVTGTYANTGLFISKYITFSSPTSKDQDILVASKYSRSIVSPATKIAPDKVDLEFNHIASLVDIKVKKDNDLENVGATVVIRSAELNTIRNKGYFQISSYDATSNKPQLDSYGWTPEETPSTDTYYPSRANDNGVLTEPLEVTSNTTYDATGYAETTDPAALGLFTDYVLMPQDLNNSQTLRISYSITTGTDTNAQTIDYDNVDILLKDFVKANTTYTNPDNTANNGDAITGWMPGTHYTYYVTIGANAIAFTASVNAWSEVSGYKYLVQ